MIPEPHKICKFVFDNSTVICVAVPAYSKGSDGFLSVKSFEELLTEAKRIGWNGDETTGRGNVKTFTVGEYIVLPPS